MLALLTWSFFVLCTPIADAGFLVDFPLLLVVLAYYYLLDSLGITLEG